MTRKRNNMTRKFMSLKNSLFSLCILAAGACGFITPAHALNTDRTQAINIQANKYVSNEGTGVTVYEGAVQIDQGSLRILADSVTIERKDNKVSLIVAKGKPARFQQRPEEDQNLVIAEGFTIRYLVTNDRITLTENASLEQEGTTMTGESIDYDIAHSVVKANSGKNGLQGRVQIVIPPSTEVTKDAASEPKDTDSTAPTAAEINVDNKP
jgi:lipopolysaccharide export system protein LptA